MSRAKHVITASLVITFILGILNSIYKTQKLPSFRFFFGSGILFLFLQGMAEFEDELAKNIAIAIAVFTILGEGGGLLDHFLGNGASNGPLNTQPGKQSAPTGGSTGQPTTAITVRRNGGTTTVVNGAPVKPVLPNQHVSPYPTPSFTG